VFVIDAIVRDISLGNALRMVVAAAVVVEEVVDTLHTAVEVVTVTVMAVEPILHVVAVVEIPATNVDVEAT